MKLLKTGAFVRAARSARVSALNRPHSHPPPNASISSRWSSTQRAAAPASTSQAFPAQSIEISREVDPTKTAAQSASNVESTGFKQQLQQLGKENKIIRESNQSGALILGKPYVFDQTSNLPQSILDLVGRNLYHDPDHPLCITRTLIESCFKAPHFNHFNVKDPVVTVEDNFDVLGFPADHPGRSRTDTYYVNSSHLLRTHTSAHQHAAFKSLTTQDDTTRGGFTICADVYRRDSIDKSHFPIFHQMEGASVWGQPFMPDNARYAREVARRQKIQAELDLLPKTNILMEDQATQFTHDNNPIQLEHNQGEIHVLVRHLKRSLEHLVHTIFTAAQAASSDSTAKSQLQARWIEAYFPFTSPSFELEVLWNDSWLEMLGCGIVQHPILNQAGLREHVGWAWGLGIERFAMLLFGIPDIRLFWSTDPRFLKQFSRGKISKFQPFSSRPPCYKDIAFWVPATPASGAPINTGMGTGVAAAAGGDSTKSSPAQTQPAAFHENDIMEVVRDVAGSLAEDVTLVDEFLHPTSGRKSLCYRINYRSLERTLQNDEVNTLHDEVTKRLVALHGVELRLKEKIT